MMGRAKVPLRAFRATWSTELLGRPATFHASVWRAAFRPLSSVHHGRTSAMMGAFEALPAFARATEAVLATARTFRKVHLRAAGTLAEMLWRALAALIGMELAVRTAATRLMVGLRTAHIAGALLAASMFITTRSLRATGVFIARTGRRWYIATVGIGATLRFWMATIGFTTLRIAALRLRTAAIGFAALGITTLWLRAFGLGIATGGIRTALGAGSRRIGATNLRRCGRGRWFGSFLGRKRGDADGAEAEQHQTMAGCGFHGLSEVAKAVGGRLFMAWNAAAPLSLCARLEKIVTLAGTPLFSRSIQPIS